MPRPLVVVADPNEATRSLLDDVFRLELGAFVTLLSSPSDLASVLKESVPALVVVEVGRDRLSDVESIRALKKEHPDIPFLCLTAWGIDVDEVEERSGVERVVAKPFDLEQLVALAWELVGRGSVSQEATAP